jgi:hypothetical protein
MLDTYLAFNSGRPRGVDLQEGVLIEGGSPHEKSRRLVLLQTLAGVSEEGSRSSGDEFLRLGR